ncbi:MAG: DUF6289 family protein [Calothrix sp. MO_192.B10]|nr:DUF6289 family protein [Calothrix sp. MO_192.B10]
MNHKSGKLLTIAGILSLVALPLPVTALPSQEVTKIYYSNAAKTKVVGISILACNGRRSTKGKTTPYVRISSSPCSSRKGGGGTKLPCEFTSRTPEQQRRCHNLPNQRP